MYLKSIEIQGFKSFAHKISFQFHNGITGIVGPNGSGKSNVADAVRWVLGEQRVKQLRGSNMQDVIFSGTEARRPFSYAYVAITLDNRDRQLATSYEEVTVARRIYRSGESEYLMNGSACKLKDINELFYDTGIGKEGYSIIGQGQIDKILSEKPGERRELFDEAVGIVKFKRRKAATQQKLENEKLNLVRVKDILSELGKQIEPLEKRSEVARAYLKKRENLKKLDAHIFLLENNRLKGELKVLEENHRLVSGELREAGERQEGVKRDYERTAAQLEALDEAIDKARSQLTDTGLMRGRLEGQINVLKEQIRSAEASAAHLNSRKAKVAEETEEKSREREGVRKRREEIDLALREQTVFREEAKAALEQAQEEVAGLNQKIEAGKNIIIEELNKKAVIRSKLGRLDTMMEQAGIRRSQLHSRLLRARSDEAVREKTVKRWEEAFSGIGRELLAMRETEKQKQEALDGIRGKLTAKDAELRGAQTLYHQEKSRLDAFLNMAERYDGYGGSIQKVMERKDREKGIHGVIADIIQTQKEYEIAIETALGGNIQNIVTDSEETAKRMIRYLKENRFGRATFLPLTGVSRPQEFARPRILQETGVIGLAHELVQVEEQYRNVAKSLLGRILVVDHVDHAIQIARRSGFSVRMVTLEGELFQPGGAISGGAFKNSSSLLSRRREIEELTGQVNARLLEIDRIGKEIEEIKTGRNQLRAQLEALKADMQRKSIEQNTARLGLSQSRERMDEEAQDFQSLQKEEGEIAAQILEITEEKASIQKELARSEELEKTTKKQIAGYQESLKEKRVLESEAATAAAQWELKTQKTCQTREFYQTDEERMEEELRRFGSEAEEIAHALLRHGEEVEHKQREILELQATIDASQEEQTQHQERLRQDSLRREELSAKQKDFFRTREEISQALAALDRESYRLNARKEKLEETIESQIHYMWEEYELTLRDAMLLGSAPAASLAAMKTEVAALREQIRKLGNVDVNAIEDYRNLMERYTFLKTQHDDLVEAQKNLEDIVQELDGAMRKQFQEKFSKIGREFDRVFQELFGGGKAILELMEEEDLLEAGIRVIAQPPGKKVQNMMQLSGGEKALTAISLLFAIQNLKPSPFCLLDEIEATLDESNVSRFAKYLHKLTRSTQFIIITHRRGTMEQADRLYGITMQEKGVSTLVSVSLMEKELEKEIQKGNGKKKAESDGV
ncbi:MAG: chromosome segregation protein SMC [Clostridium sp.]|jgi:chromosome segregation protein|nr:chromosome segregation protein SMC [Clostridium sp.]